MLCIPVQCHECIATAYRYTVLHEVTCTRAVDPIQSINLGCSGPTACDPLRLSSTATFATHLHSHERFYPLLSRAFDLLFLAPASESWLQPAKSRAQPCPQEHLPFHAYSTGELHGNASSCSVLPALQECGRSVCCF